VNVHLVAAAWLAILVGLAHSLLGERLIFSRLRQRREFVPTDGGTVLREPHVRILWASWHALTVLGWAMAGAMLLMASEPALTTLQIAVLRIMALAMLAAAALVVIGTRARHPGWIGLLLVAALTCLGTEP
jgi:hypothetical protein